MNWGAGSGSKICMCRMSLKRFIDRLESIPDSPKFGYGNIPQYWPREKANSLIYCCGQRTSSTNPTLSWAISILEDYHCLICHETILSLPGEKWIQYRSRKGWAHGKLQDIRKPSRILPSTVTVMTIDLPGLIVSML